MQSFRSTSLLIPLNKPEM